MEPEILARTMFETNAESWRKPLVAITPADFGPEIAEEGICHVQPCHLV